MKQNIKTEEITELLTVWFDERDDDDWITKWSIKDKFSDKQYNTKTNRFIQYMIKNWEMKKSGKSVFYRPKKHWQYLRIGDKTRKSSSTMKRNYTCKKCGKNGHNTRTCIVDEDLSRHGKPFQLRQPEVKYINEEKVNHPSHYNPGNIEVIDAIEDWGLDFNSGNVIKYIVRSCSSGDKKHNTREDLEKAIWYINRILNNE